MNIIDSSQPNSVTYCLKLQTKFIYLQYFVQFCETLSESIVYFEAEDTKNIENKPEDLWQIDVFLDKKPNIEKLQAKFATIALQCQSPTPSLELSEIENIDWVSEVQKTFVPILAGKFFIHHSGYKEQMPNTLIPIEINAGRAFGTGEHETTSNCLKALSELNITGNCLDMGCGSGILAIAMAKTGAKKVIAADLDEQAVSVTRENTNLNNVSFIEAMQSNGYQSSIIEEAGPYEVISANILALPLIEMAPDAYKNLAKGGFLILAGFLKDQLDNVLLAHQNQGLILVKEICIENWPALIMTKI
jgi:ribosomal protein L11 methyltransferase